MVADKNALDYRGMRVGYEEVFPETANIDEKLGYNIVKRIFDFVCSLVAIIVLSPLMLAVGIAIKLEDGDPIIFTQTRIGKDSKPFKMYKFRSMWKNAEKYLSKLEDQNEADGPVFKIEDDPRITRVGKFIRRYSIDELPQLFNILKGDMSIVGPRPPLENEVECYTSYERQRLNVKPGLTCYWQCSGRSNIGFDEWMELDMKYINERSALTDLKLIFKTIPAVLKHDGAC